MVVAEQPFDFLPDARIVHAHLRQEMDVVEVGAAIVWGTVAANQLNNPLHGGGYPRHVLPDELRQRTGRSGKLVSRLVHLQHVFVRHSHEQIQLVRKIIDDARLCQPAGSGKRDDACFLVVHPDKHPECLVYHFFTVGYYHTPLFLIGYEDTDFCLSTVCIPVIFLVQGASIYLYI